MRAKRVQYTCKSCAHTFETAEQQRIHYTTDYHRYNLKRKVAGLVALSQADYDQRSKMVQQQPTVKVQQLECSACQKTFASQKTLDSHMQSKKHLTQSQVKQPVKTEADDGMVQQLKEDSKKAKIMHDKLVDAASEREIKEILAQKECQAIKLDIIKDCLFCIHQASSMDDNVVHMQDVHSFHVPSQSDLKYEGLQGLLQYLADQITVNNICIWCQSKGKTFWSVEGVRHHMIDMGHCSVGVEDAEVVEDLAQFYSFEDDWQDTDNMQLVAGDYYEEQPDEDAGVWHLPSGAVGHRSMQKYYKQRFRVDLDPQTGNELVLSSDRSGRGHDIQRKSTVNLDKQRVMQKDQIRDKKRIDRVNLRAAVRSFKIQGKYFRPQVDF